MAIIQTIKSGNCTIYIDDEYCVKTQEEKNEILRRIGEIYYTAWVEGKLKSQKEEIEE